MPEYLRMAAAYRMIIFGAALLLMICVMPQGMIPAMRRLPVILGPRQGRVDARGA
jgi:ABC-type branched-subunit amino acid transport system permease subunit